MRQVITGRAGYCGRGAGSAALVFLALQGPAAAGDGIGDSGAASPVVVRALGGGAAPQGFPSPWVLSQGVAGGWGR